MMPWATIGQTEREALYICGRCGGEKRVTYHAGTQEKARLRKRPPLCVNCGCVMDLGGVVPVVRAQR